MKKMLGALVVFGFVVAAFLAACSGGEPSVSETPVREPEPLTEGYASASRVKYKAEQQCSGLPSWWDSSVIPAVDTLSTIQQFALAEGGQSARAEYLIYPEIRINDRYVALGESVQVYLRDSEEYGSSIESWELEPDPYIEFAFHLLGDEAVNVTLIATWEIQQLEDDGYVWKDWVVTQVSCSISPVVP